MKRRTLLGLAATLPLISVRPATAQNTKGMDALECIHTRRSTRKFLDKPVPEDIITQLLEAAMTAPSGHNSQPWHFVVVTDRARLQAVADAGAKPAGTATAGILVCGEPALARDSGLWPLDCSNASMSILLAANALGVGSVWTAAYPHAQRSDAYRKLFALPENITPFAFICLGWPEKPTGREKRFKPERIHRQTWS